MVMSGRNAFIATLFTLVVTTRCLYDNDEFLDMPAASQATSVPENRRNESASEAMYLKITVEDVGPVNELDMSVGLDARMELSWPFHTGPCPVAFAFLGNLRHVRYEGGGRRVIASPITFATYATLAAELHLPEAVVREARLVRSASDTFEDKELMLAMDNASVGQRCIATYSVRQTTILDCLMEFSNYPREIHECNISIRITTLPDSVTRFLWAQQNPIKVNPNVDLVRFEVAVQGKVEPTSTTSTVVSGETDEGPELQLRLARRMGDHLVSTYAPTALLVVCSWPAFWLATAERLSLCGTLLLALTQQSASARRALPPSVALTSVDWWMSGCIGLVLAVIVETTAACFEDKILPRWRVNRVMPRQVEAKDSPAYTKRLLRHLVSVARPQGRMDAVACLLFPAAFLLFNACYWASMYGGSECSSPIGY